MEKRGNHFLNLDGTKQSNDLCLTLSTQRSRQCSPCKTIAYPSVSSSMRMLSVRYSPSLGALQQKTFFAFMTLQGFWGWPHWVELALGPLLESFPSAALTYPDYLRLTGGAQECRHQQPKPRHTLTSIHCSRGERDAPSWGGRKGKH